MTATIKNRQNAGGNSVEYLEVELDKSHANYNDFLYYLEDNGIEVGWVDEDNDGCILEVYPEDPTDYPSHLPAFNTKSDIMDTFNGMFTD